MSCKLFFPFFSLNWHVLSLVCMCLCWLVGWCCYHIFSFKYTTNWQKPHFFHNFVHGEFHWFPSSEFSRHFSLLSLSHWFDLVRLFCFNNMWVHHIGVPIRLWRKKKRIFNHIRNVRSMQCNIKSNEPFYGLFVVDILIRSARIHLAVMLSNNIIHKKVFPWTKYCISNMILNHLMCFFFALFFIYIELVGFPLCSAIPPMHFCERVWLCLCCGFQWLWTQFFVVIAFVDISHTKKTVQHESKKKKKWRGKKSSLNDHT